MTIKKTLVSLLSALSFCTPSQAQDNWANARAGFNTESQSLSAHSEAHFRISSFGYLYEVLYLDRKQLQDKEFLDYLEKLRLHYDLGNISGRLRGFGLASEFNKGRETQGTFRLGLAYEIAFKESGYCLIKLYPVNFGSGEKLQGSLFVSQDISRRLNASVLLNYNFQSGKSNNAYLESEVTIRLYKDLGLFLQGRIATAQDGTLDRRLVFGAIFYIK